MEAGGKTSVLKQVYESESTSSASTWILAELGVSCWKLAETMWKYGADQ